MSELMIEAIKRAYNNIGNKRTFRSYILVNSKDLERWRKENNQFSDTLYFERIRVVGMDWIDKGDAVFYNPKHTYVDKDHIIREYPKDYWLDMIREGGGYYK